MRYDWRGNLEGPGTERGGADGPCCGECRDTTSVESESTTDAPGVQGPGVEGLVGEVEPVTGLVDEWTTSAP